MFLLIISNTNLGLDYSFKCEASQWGRETTPTWGYHPGKRSHRGVGWSELGGVTFEEKELNSKKPTSMLSQWRSQDFINGGGGGK